jgi:GH15 family glucan-1,4-alpha-glucosidase
MRSIALVSIDGSIDWFCHPRFDSPSVFAAILDDAKGGRFRVSPTHEGPSARQYYWPDSNILMTRFLSGEGMAELQDFMPVGSASGPGGRQEIVRRLTVLQGGMSFDVECSPAFDYARAEHDVEILGDGRAVVFRSRVDGVTLALQSSVPLESGPAGGARARFRLEEGGSAVFVLHGLAPGETVCVDCPSQARARSLFEETLAFWQGWISRCTYRGRWRENVRRSALALKLLTHAPSGGIVAAATCSLPEEIGGERNWDYRYMWLRDAAFTVYAFMRIGFTDEAAAFMDFLATRAKEGDEACDGDTPPLGILYTLDGNRRTPEFELSHLEGYRGSRPVRVGNAADGQLQLDVFGEFVDAVYLFNKYGRLLSYDTWKHVRGVVDWVAKHWRRPDHGIWEPRVGPRQHTHSKLMCWVALDRALRLADKRSFPAPREEWRRERDDIYETIFEQGWNAEKGAFVQTLGGEALDASLLLMPLVLFVAADDPRMTRTLEAIRRSPRAGGLSYDGLVRRYHLGQTTDGLGGDEGTFNMCSFWLVEALARAAGSDHRRLDEARLMFERLLGFGNHLGLYAEQIGRKGEALGNFPQALTHLGLISAAHNLDRALG